MYIKIYHFANVFIENIFCKILLDLHKKNTQSDLDSSVVELPLYKNAWILFEEHWFKSQMMFKYDLKFEKRKKE